MFIVMKMLLIPAIAASFLSIHAVHLPMQGHQNGHQQGHAKVDGARVAKDLALTADQIVKVKEIRFNLLKTVIHALHSDNADHAAHTKVMEHSASQLKSVLTKDQMAKLDEAGAHALLDLRLAHIEFFEKLNASETQIAGLKERMRETHEKIDAIKGHNLPAEETHQHLIKTLRAGLERMKELLTPEQVKRAHELLGGQAK